MNCFRRTGSPLIPPALPLKLAPSPSAYLNGTTAHGVLKRPDASPMEHGVLYLPHRVWIIGNPGLPHVLLPFGGMHAKLGVILHALGKLVIVKGLVRVPAQGINYCGGGCCLALLVGLHLKLMLNVDVLPLQGLNVVGGVKLRFRSLRGVPNGVG